MQRWGIAAMTSWYSSSQTVSFRVHFVNKAGTTIILDRCMQLEWEEGAGTIPINDTDYELRQCHWHSPSEHSIDGKRSSFSLLMYLFFMGISHSFSDVWAWVYSTSCRFAMELHMVHISADQRVAVVGIMYAIGRPDAFLSEVWALELLKHQEHIYK